jgi:hypothetical protein
MRMLAAAVVAIGFLAVSTSPGANLIFDPSGVSLSTGRPVTFAVSVSGTLPFNAWDVIFQSDSAAPLSFAFAPPWNDPGVCHAYGDMNMTDAENELWASGVMDPVVYIAPSIPLGWLTIDLTGLPMNRSYTVSVDGGEDGVSGINTPMGLECLIGSVTIAPEPATVTLLAIGGLLVARRRRV